MHFHDLLQFRNVRMMLAELISTTDAVRLMCCNSDAANTETGSFVPLYRLIVRLTEKKCLNDHTIPLVNPDFLQSLYTPILIRTINEYIQICAGAFLPELMFCLVLNGRFHAYVKHNRSDIHVMRKSRHWCFVEAWRVLRENKINRKSWLYWLDLITNFNNYTGFINSPVTTLYWKIWTFNCTCHCENLRPDYHFVLAYCECDRGYEGNHPFAESKMSMSCVDELCQICMCNESLLEQSVAMLEKNRLQLHKTQIVVDQLAKNVSELQHKITNRA